MRKYSPYPLLILLFIPILLFARAAELEPRDVNAKVNEILFTHISQKKLTPEIMRRALGNFIENLDPMKSYFTQEEIQEYLDQTDEQLQQNLEAFYKSDFSQFDEIHKRMLGCITRREKLEAKIEDAPLLEDVITKDLETEEWTENVDSLQERLLKIKSLQASFASKIEDADFESKFLKLVAKRRKWREDEISGTNEEIRKRILHAEILKAIASALDSQTVYFPPSEANLFMMQVQQRLMGIGVQLIDDLTGFKIMSLVDGGPAKVQGGLQEKDLIVAVDDEYVVGMDINQAVQMIRGKEHTKVKLTILRAKDEDDTHPEKIDVCIKRGEIVIEESRIESSVEPFADGHIGHITLHSFYQDPQNSCGQDLYEKLSELKKDYNLKGVILDLRNNTGGILPQTVAVNSLFMGKGIVVSIKKYDGSVHHLRNVESSPLWDGPLIILVNKLSASAAEIVAQSLRDYGRALLIGDERTFGKGTYQITTLNVKNDHINPQGEYKVTEGMYYTVSGRSPQLVGVKPDIVAPGYLAEADVGEKFSKYPVENNQIASNFEDRLDDVPSYQREKVKRYYHFDLQPVLKTYTKHLPKLLENSKSRIEKNGDYQTMLTHLKEVNETDKEFKGGQNDFQLEEALNIMKDLIYLDEQAKRTSS